MTDYFVVPGMPSGIQAIHTCGSTNIAIFKTKGNNDPLDAKRQLHAICLANSIDPTTLVTANLLHNTTNIIEATTPDPYNTKPADALITNRRDITLFLYAADCALCVLASKHSNAIGLVHLSWRGLIENDILNKTIDKLCTSYGLNHRDLVCYVGPHLGFCHFEVSSDFAKGTKFEQYVHDSHFDFDQAIRNTTFADIDLMISSHCTYCHGSPSYHSYRRAPLNSSREHTNGQYGALVRLI